MSAQDWSEVSLDEDPFAEHRPSAVDCSGWGPEGAGIEVDTAKCNYLALAQPMRELVEPGDTVQLSLWWQWLASIDPTYGHIAVLIGDELVFEESVAIPGPADARDVDVEIGFRAERGTPITLHLHNHGYNTWRFEQLSLRRGSCQSCVVE